MTAAAGPRALRVRSRIGLGTMGLTGRGTWGFPSDRAGARTLLRTAVEQGVELIDTADAYGPGAAEELIGEALAPYASNLCIATKGGLTRQGPNRWGRDGRPEHLTSACEASLARLRLDSVELYQLHAVDPRVPLEDSVGALVELRRQGKIRQIGLCNVSREELRRALELTEIASVQNRYSLVGRSSEDVLTLCEERGIAFLPWAPLAKGYLRDGPFARTAARHGVPPSQLALAWLLHRSPVILPIPGTTSESHLLENLGAAAVSLTASDVQALSSRRYLGYRARQARRRARVLAGRLRMRTRSGRR